MSHDLFLNFLNSDCNAFGNKKFYLRADLGFERHFLYFSFCNSMPKCLKNQLFLLLKCYKGGWGVGGWGGGGVRKVSRIFLMAPKKSKNVPKLGTNMLMDSK